MSRAFLLSHAEALPITALACDLVATIASDLRTVCDCPSARARR
jgi:hypothetical protein